MAWGNYNVAGYDRHFYITFADASDSLALDGKCKALTLYATAACWVKIGRGAQTAAAPTGEKVKNAGYLYIPASMMLSGIRVSGNDEYPWHIAVIQDSAGGTLHVFEHWDF